MVTIVCSDKLYVTQEGLPEPIYEAIVASLTIPNPDKPRAKKEMMRGWEDMPDVWQLYEETETMLILPRGFRDLLVTGMQKTKTKHTIIDAMSRGVDDPDLNTLGWKIPELRHEQPNGVQAIIDQQQGILEAPTGSGKTVMVLEAIRRANRKAIVIVDKTNIAQQWADRALEHFGAEVGIIGDQSWDEDHLLTIALRQSLWARRHSLTKRKFWQQFGFMGLDECHHATAETLQELVQLFPALYRIGASATPDRDPATFPLLTELVGGVIYEMPDTVMKITPTVEVVRTHFSYNFQPTQLNDEQKVVRNNYAPMMSKLTKDKARNTEIARIAVKEARAGHRVLVTSRQKGHLDAINRIIFSGSDVDVHMLTGDQSTERRMEIGELVSAGPCIVLSTIADEALDMPAFDRLILAFPTRNTAIVQQQVGRVRREHVTKHDAVVYDILDENVRVLKSQFKDRRRDVYRKLNMPVNI